MFKFFFSTLRVLFSIKDKAIILITHRGLASNLTLDRRLLVQGLCLFIESIDWKDTEKTSMRKALQAQWPKTATYTATVDEEVLKKVRKKWGLSG